MGVRTLKIAALLFFAMGLAWLPPYAFELLLGAELSALASRWLWISPAMLVGALVFLLLGRQSTEARPPMPSPIRLAILINLLFLAFCSLEFADGVVRQEGRVFYWTSVLFLPALAILFGLVSAQRWAWWMARGFAITGSIFFAGMIAAIPFGDLRSQGQPVGPAGRGWMIAVTSIFFGAVVLVFRALGKAETRGYFDMRSSSSKP